MLGGVSEAQNSTVRIGAEVDPDRFDTGVFGVAHHAAAVTLRCPHECLTSQAVAHSR